MSHLTMNELSGMGSAGARAFTKVSGGSARSVMRPMVSNVGFSGLGEASECGPSPELAPGEQKKCCPDVGWVIFDSGESQYGLCRRAGGGSDAPAALPGDPTARVEEMRRRINARRDEADERRHEAAKKELKLRFLASQMAAVRAKEAARVQSLRDAATAKLQAKVKAKQAIERRERNKKLLIGGAVVALGAKLFGAF